MALSNVRKCHLGGGVEMLHGNYTHTAAAASETIVVDGEVIQLVVNPQASAGTAYDANLQQYSVSAATGALRTVSFLQNCGVSAGTFSLTIRKG